MQDICLDLKSKVPIYIQIREQLRLMIVTGKFPEGSQMPPVRDLAQELLINPNTVSKAYQELEREGYIHTQRGMGTFVSNREADKVTEEAGAYAERLAEEMVGRLMELGLKGEEIRELVKKILDSRTTDESAEDTKT